MATISPVSAYAAAGRLNSGSWSGVNSRSFTWDPEGKLLSYADANPATTTYAFDPFGRRSRTTPTSGPIPYNFYGAEDGGHPVARYDTTKRLADSDPGRGHDAGLYER